MLPHLGIGASLPKPSGWYLAALHKTFTLYFGATPSMANTTIYLQIRRPPSTTWVTLSSHPTNVRGLIALPVTFGRTGWVDLRWQYRGGARAPYRWLSASSIAAVFHIR